MKKVGDELGEERRELSLKLVTRLGERLRLYLIPMGEVLRFLFTSLPSGEGYMI